MHTYVYFFVYSKVKNGYKGVDGPGIATLTGNPGDPGDPLESQVLLDDSPKSDPLDTGNH